MPKLGTKNGGVHVCQDMTEKDEGARKGTQERPYREKNGRIVPPSSDKQGVLYLRPYSVPQIEREKKGGVSKYVEASPGEHRDDRPANLQTGLPF